MGSLLKYWQEFKHKKIDWSFFVRKTSRSDSPVSPIFGMPIEAMSKDFNAPSTSAPVVKVNPAVVAAELEELSKPMLAPEVPLMEMLPDFACAELTPVLSNGGRSLLLVPEEEDTRWFAIFDESLIELGRTSVEEHEKYMQSLNKCCGGAVTLENGQRYRVEDFRSFNEFGDRYALQFFAEGALSFDESILRRRDNIRLVNRLKPADTVTAKNEDDLAQAVLKNGKATVYLDHLMRDGLLSSEKRSAVGDDEADLLAIMRSINIPRKMAAIALADCLGVEYLEVGGVYFDKIITHSFGKQWKRERQVFPFIIEEGQVQVAMADPSDQETIDAIEKRYHCKARVFCSAARDIDNMIKKAHKDDQTPT